MFVSLLTISCRHKDDTRETQKEIAFGRKTCNNTNLIIKED